MTNVITPTYSAPSNPLEEALVEIWQVVLEVPQVGIQDDFFDLGGHSLLSIEIRSRVKDLLGVSNIKVDLLDTPTVASMAQAIFQQLAAGLPANGGHQ